MTSLLLARPSSRLMLRSSSAPPRYLVPPKALPGTAGAVSMRNISVGGTRIRPLCPTGEPFSCMIIGMRAPLPMASVRSQGQSVAAGAAAALGTYSRPTGKSPFLSPSLGEHSAYHSVFTATHNNRAPQTRPSADRGRTICTKLLWSRPALDRPDVRMMKDLRMAMGISQCVRLTRRQSTECYPQRSTSVMHRSGSSSPR